MRKPPHPRRIVRQECIEPSGLTVTDAAARLGVTRQALNNLIHENAGISPTMALRLATFRFECGGMARAANGLRLGGSGKRDES